MPRPVNILTDVEWPAAGFSFELPIEPASAALGVIDVQGYLTDVSGHLAHTLQRHSPRLQREFLLRVDTMVSNISRLMAVFRQGQRRVFFTRHGFQSGDGSDLVLRRRWREQAAQDATSGESGHMASRLDASYQIDRRVAPLPGELVLDKNTSSAFHTTPIDLYLRNMGVATIVLTGAASDQCVLSTAIDAADRGFHVIIATDAVANWDPGSAEATQILFGRIWGYVMTTQAIADWMETGQPPARTRLEA